MSALPVEDIAQALYRFFDASGELLYVGITMNPVGRWASHRTEKPWWSEVATITLESHPSREAVERAERDAIRAERPRYNVAHHPDRWPARAQTVSNGPCVGSYEIGELLGVSRQRVHQLAQKPDFPAPAAVLALGAVWRTSDVRAWAEARGRAIHDE